MPSKDEGRGALEGIVSGYNCCRSGTIGVLAAVKVDYFQLQSGEVSGQVERFIEL